MNQSLNKRKIIISNSIRSPKMNIINNLGNYKYAKDHKKSQNEKKQKMPNQKKPK